MTINGKGKGREDLETRVTRLERELCRMKKEREEAMRLRPVDAWAAQYPPLYEMLPRLVRARKLEPTREGYNWVGGRQALFLWLFYFLFFGEFRDWKNVARFFLVNGDEVTGRGLSNAFRRLGHVPADAGGLEALMPKADLYA